MTDRILLVRHTRLAVAPGTCYGRLDLPLADTGVQDVAAAIARIPASDFLFTSPAKRCRTLAAALASRDGIAVHEDPRLLELDFGEWEGKGWDDVPRPEIDRWAQNPLHTAPGGGESLRSMWERIAEFMRDSLGQSSGTTTIVSHHGPLRVLWAQLSALRPGAIWAFTIDYGGIHAVGKKEI